MSDVDFDAAYAGMDLRELAAKTMRERDQLRAELATERYNHRATIEQRDAAQWAADVKAKAAIAALADRDSARSAHAMMSAAYDRKVEECHGLRAAIVEACRIGLDWMRIANVEGNEEADAINRDEKRLLALRSSLLPKAGDE